MKLRVSCGMYVGPAKWRLGHDWTLEPDECGFDGEIEIDDEDWDERFPPPFECPSCGANLEDDSHFEPIE